ncbi:bifunctional methylenetetrahydrofolate dehydrogenase/methenyltetrahydrofolate cyclohydrolase FolD [Bacillus sp. 2205SS5-2]|uniref:bifunctional methylenetetrahydrofolate dehydrogenase/methenyltetrahydrofolate cyclohydrolase FolD n=1 Tax=Bacillus sp. 2205SS5-2 TaxID=3109031 RepID=UPI00300580E9
MATLLNGKEISQKIRESIHEEVKTLNSQGVTPSLAVILIGNNQASKTYVSMKQKACEKLGMNSVLIEYPESLPQAELLAKIQQLNDDSSIHGILVQLPLPNHISEKLVIEAILPEKDVDGFHPLNVGRMMNGKTSFLPCTPFGIMKMLESENIDVEGKHVVIVGRSNIVGKPAGQLFLQQNATVTYCHSKTKDLVQHTQMADIVVSAVGTPNLITKKHVKKGAIVIDVGMNRNEKGKLCGDVDFTAVKEVASYITPVPGGVGPMTITMLLFNTLLAAQNTQHPIVPAEQS